MEHVTQRNGTLMDTGKAIKFIVDHNVGRLTTWLRVMGYDTVFFRGDDSRMIQIALAEDRIVLTKDTQIMKRRVVTSGRVKGVLIRHDDLWAQLRQVVDELKLDYASKAFTLCLECNRPLVSREKEEVKDLVPPYVFKTQTQYRQCPSCGRVYWRGTHWQAMSLELSKLAPEAGK